LGMDYWRKKPANTRQSRLRLGGRHPYKRKTDGAEEEGTVRNWVGGLCRGFMVLAGSPPVVAFDSTDNRHPPAAAKGAAVCRPSLPFFFTRKIRPWSRASFLWFVKRRNFETWRGGKTKRAPYLIRRGSLIFWDVCGRPRRRWIAWIDLCDRSDRSVIRRLEMRQLEG
jgi:hypothetical protein